MLTVATKIMYGAIPGLTKARYHSLFFRRQSFADMLLDVLSIATPNLIITDGILAMEGDGPMGGKQLNLDLILASENPIAIDLTICKILDIEPIGIPTLRQAKIRNMWPSNIQYPLLSPQDVKYSGFILPSTAGYLLTGKKRPARSPVPNRKCTACGDCQVICPKDAIKMKNEIAKVNYTLCIRCYCCHEVCPEKAIDLKVIK